MKKILFLLIISVVNQSCKNETEIQSPLVCGVMDPIKELAWLDNILSGNGDCEIYGGASLYSYRYKGVTVLNLRNPASSLGICTELYYDCSGKKLFSTVKEQNNFKARRTDEKLLWKK